MAVLDYRRRQQIISQIAIKESQLEKANTTYSSLLEKEIESYRFDSNEGSQQATRRKLTELKSQIDSLESEIENLRNKLNAAGLVNVNMRRKHRLC